MMPDVEPLTDEEIEQIVEARGVNFDGYGAVRALILRLLATIRQRTQERQLLRDEVRSMDHARDCRGPWGTCNCARAALSPATEEPGSRDREET